MAELNLEEVSQIAPDELSEDQQTFIKDNADDLSDEQKETYKGIIEEKEEEVKDPEDIEIETRQALKEAKDKDDDEVDPDDEKVIEKIVAKKLKEAGLSTTKDQVEVDAYLRANPDFGKYRSVMLKYLAHPAYRNIPVSNVAAIVAAKDMQKLGAKKEREVSKKAKATQSGGSSARKADGGKIDWFKASSKEVEAEVSKVLRQR